MTYQSIESYSLSNTPVLVRVDFNVPMKSGQITDDTRIKATIPTLKILINKGARIALMSHLGDPKPGQKQELFSLKPVAKRLSELIHFPVNFELDWENPHFSKDAITLFENVRFLRGETQNDAELAKKMASLCQVYIMDAFASAHRSHASTEGIAKYVQTALAGPLVIKETEAISILINNIQHPFIAIIGGAKISTKLPLLLSLIPKVDKLIIGGGMANTCLKAMNYPIGNSLFEKELLDKAHQLITNHSHKIPLPTDVLVAKKLETGVFPHPVKIEKIFPDDLIGDLGIQTTLYFCDLISKAKTILWNGPVGVFEIPEFQRATRYIATAIANNRNAYSVVGGGDTISAIKTFNLNESDYSHVSTGGGAFLAYLEDQNLPGLRHLLTHDTTN